MFFRLDGLGLDGVGRRRSAVVTELFSFDEGGLANAAHPSRLVSAPVSMTIAATKEAAVVPALAISVWVWPSLRTL